MLDDALRANNVTPSGGGISDAASTPLSDDVERALHEARTLLERAADKYRISDVNVADVVNIDLERDGIPDEFLRWSAEAQECIDVVISGKVEQARRLFDYLRFLRIAGNRHPVRVLCDYSVVDREFVEESHEDEHPAEIRVGRVPPLQAIIVDDRAALMHAESLDGRRASIVRVETQVRGLRSFFEEMWRHAALVALGLNSGDPAREEAVQQVLMLLRMGVTDEVAARKLSVSVRTYRRHVAEIMALLGAKSRFQAGVLAAKAGLVPSRNLSREIPAQATRDGRGGKPRLLQ